MFSIASRRRRRTWPAAFVAERDEHERGHRGDGVENQNSERRKDRALHRKLDTLAAALAAQLRHEMHAI